MIHNNNMQSQILRMRLTDALVFFMQMDTFQRTFCGAWELCQEHRQLTGKQIIEVVF